jgi:hypothetical protein
VLSLKQFFHQIVHSFFHQQFFQFSTGVHSFTTLSNLVFLISNQIRLALSEINFVNLVKASYLAIGLFSFTLTAVPNKIYAHLMLWVGYKSWWSYISGQVFAAFSSSIVTFLKCMTLGHHIQKMWQDMKNTICIIPTGNFTSWLRSTLKGSAISG